MEVSSGCGLGVCGVSFFVLFSREGPRSERQTFRSGSLRGG